VLCYNTKMKIFILLGHPNTDDTFCESLADAYEKGASEAGHEVKRMNIGEMQFDPILHKGYKVIQQLEPDLVIFQENIKWCDNFVVVYPTWWTNTPALLKGLFDRAWISGFAFRFKSNGLWTKLLIGKSARVITTMGAPVIFEWLLFGKVTRTLSNNILKFAGFKVRETWIGNAEKMKIEKREKWIKNIQKKGKGGI
jgi:NAD(P)H dehydrogenase (quinone)